MIKLLIFGKDNPHRHSIDSSFKLLCDSWSSWILVSICKLLHKDTPPILPIKLSNYIINKIIHCKCNFVNDKIKEKECERRDIPKSLIWLSM